MLAMNGLMTLEIAYSLKQICFIANQVIFSYVYNFIGGYPVIISLAEAC